MRHIDIVRTRSRRDPDQQQREAGAPVAHRLAVKIGLPPEVDTILAGRMRVAYMQSYTIMKIALQRPTWASSPTPFALYRSFHRNELPVGDRIDTQCAVVQQDVDSDPYHPPLLPSLCHRIHDCL